MLTIKLTASSTSDFCFFSPIPVRLYWLIPLFKVSLDCAMHALKMMDIIEDVHTSVKAIPAWEVEATFEEKQSRAMAQGHCFPCNRVGHWPGMRLHTGDACHGLAVRYLAHVKRFRYINQYNYGEEASSVSSMPELVDPEDSSDDETVDSTMVPPLVR